MCILKACTLTFSMPKTLRLIVILIVTFTVWPLNEQLWKDFSLGIGSLMPWYDGVLLLPLGENSTFQAVKTLGYREKCQNYTYILNVIGKRRVGNIYWLKNNWRIHTYTLVLLKECFSRNSNRNELWLRIPFKLIALIVARWLHLSY